MRGQQEQKAMCLIRCMLNDKICRCLYWFGCSRNDILSVTEFFNSATANQSPNEFPDYISNNLAIEHFEITSSKEIQRKGALRKKDDAMFKRRKEQKIVQIENAISQLTEPVEDMIFFAGEFPKQEHSHEFLMNSFEKNCRHHLSSLAQYNEKTGRSASEPTIFVVEYQDSALGMAETYNIGNNDKCGSLNAKFDYLQHSDAKRFDYNMESPVRLRSYRLCYDAKLLLWIYENCKTLKYIVFLGTGCLGSGVEVIKIAEIPYMLKMIPNTIKTYSFTSIRTSFDVRFSL